MGLIMGDGLYSLTKILYSVVQRFRMMQSLKQQLQEEPEMTQAEYAEGQPQSQFPSQLQKITDL